jgi:hypothetical protein
MTVPPAGRATTVRGARRTLAGRLTDEQPGEIAAAC